MGKVCWNLLVASASESDLTGLTHVFYGLKEIRLLPPARTGAATLRTLSSQTVDILMLDLSISQIDGLSVLERVSAAPKKLRPTVFLMSSFTDDRLLRMVHDKAVYCFIKPLNYANVALRVLQLMRFSLMPETAEPVSPKTLPEKITLYICAMGVPAHLKGYPFLRDSVQIYLEWVDKGRVSITNTIYPEIAKRYDTRAPLVEHAMRTAIETAWTRGNIDKLHEYFGYTVNDKKGKPSNLEFVAMIAERIRNNMPV